MPLWTKIFHLFRLKKQPDKEPAPEEPSEFELLEDRLRKLQKYERRQANLLEHMHQEVSWKLDRILAQQDSGLPVEEIATYAESFALYRQSRPHDEALQNTWNKFTAMLEAMGIELIADNRQQFDDSRHEVCDIRFEPHLPEGSVLEVVRPGLIIHGQITRPAVVVVNTSTAQEAAAQSAL
ncbi:MAG: nucleotide exchange factor GrpE [Desulfovermiculus sp.]|nr:nucleotide exchange factor GrpE [Desulfovermiculus sp.]